MKKLLALLLTLLLTLPLAQAEASSIVNLIKHPDAEYQFQYGATLLEIFFPRVYSSDCFVIRYGDEVMMIDASTKDPRMQGRIKTALAAIGVDHIDVAYNSHPHDDHIDGFASVHAYAPISQLIITFPKDFNSRMREAMAFTQSAGIPVVSMGDGDVITLGDGAVKMTIIQHHEEDWPVNDRSAMLKIEYGDRSFLFAGDNENRSQNYQLSNPPAVGLKADIFKYPHHGQVQLKHEWLLAIDPELIFMNGASDVMAGGKAYCNRIGREYMFVYQGLTRMRTDGSIWVVDYIEEPGADLKLPFNTPRTNEFAPPPQS